ncbi:ATP-binding protein [Nocardioides sp.]|uniref:ATP-binding protein n=1 Tax=Nocardioides sp. TaxID=35761 RepID=UPI002630FA19|nr:ATP-binding protein [Nocardioides sp.]MDI6909797.1 PAS domain S-box protein [Nocardioides sp.]
MSSSRRGQLGWPAAVGLLAGVYVAGVGAVAFAPQDDPVATWWPAAGLAAVLVAASPRRRWWVLALGICVVSGAANLTAGRPLDVSAAFGVANTSDALVASAVLWHGRGRLPRLDSLDDFLRLAAAALLGGLTMATIGTAGVHLFEGGSFGRIWLSLGASHAAATLVIVPLAMARPAIRSTRRWEVPLQVVVLATITLTVFSPNQSLSLSFLPLPVIVWAALRFDLLLTAWELVGFAVVITFLTAHGYGPFGAHYRTGEIDARTMGSLSQLYLVCTALLSLPLVIAVGQRRRLLERLTSRERLFRRNFTESLIGMVLLRSEDTPLEIVDVNEAAARIIGRAGSPVGRGLADVLDTAEPLDLVAARMLAGNLDGWRAQTGLRDRRGARVNVAISLLTTGPEATFSAQLQDVTAEYDARRRLEAAEKLTSATLDTTAAMILVTDLMGVVLRVNGATTTLTGFDEHELVGVEVWDLPFAPPGSDGYPAGLPDAIDGQVGRETDVVTRSGQRRRIQWNTGYVHDDRNRPTHVVLTGTDLTVERMAAGLNRHLLEAAISTALIGMDTAGRITVFNPGAVNLLGYDGQDTVGTPFVDLFDPEQLAERLSGATGEDAFARLVEGIDSGVATPTLDWVWIGADGRRHTVSMSLSVAADTFAARVGYLCVGRDVTEARASQEMLVAALEKERLAVERLRQLDVAKSEFVSTVSHELRTPVASIVGYTELLEDGTVVDPAPEQRPMLESIARNGQRLILLCDDLLTLSGLDSGVTSWQHDTLDLTTLLDTAEEAIRPQLAGRDLRLSLTADPGPVLVLGDRIQLERVLINLLGNAVKFTEDGGRIACRVSRQDDEAWLSVTDTGLGIPVEEQPGLFQRFFRSSTAKVHAIQGTGLGLSIVAATVAAHGGRIDVESAHLEGTTFTVRLPLAR